MSVSLTDRTAPKQKQILLLLKNCSALSFPGDLKIVFSLSSIDENEENDITVSSVLQALYKDPSFQLSNPHERLEFLSDGVREVQKGWVIAPGSHRSS